MFTGGGAAGTAGRAGGASTIAISVLAEAPGVGVVVTTTEVVVPRAAAATAQAVRAGGPAAGAGIMMMAGNGGDKPPPSSPKSSGGPAPKSQGGSPSAGAKGRPPARNAPRSAAPAAEEASQASRGPTGQLAAAQGFTAAEMSVINEVKAIPLAQLRAAYQAGGAELSIGGRTILVDPGVPASGMTLFGENGFIIGREAFASNAELTKTLLHETYRLKMSQSAAGVTGSLATAETNAAFSFAERAFGAHF